MFKTIDYSDSLFKDHFQINFNFRMTRMTEQEMIAKEKHSNTTRTKPGIWQKNGRIKVFAHRFSVKYYETTIVPYSIRHLLSKEVLPLSI